MKKIVCFGEVLIDFLNTTATANGPLMIKEFAQFPGGAPANAAVAAALLETPAAFAGQIGDDHFGHFLVDALKSYGVDTSLVSTHPTAKTPLAFVFLDEDGERSFEFYRDNSADLLMTPEQADARWFENTGLFHCCSNTLTTPAIAETTAILMAKARDAGALLCFDVNLRHNLWENGQIDRDLVNATIARSQVIKFSLEELEYLAGDQNEAYLQNLLAGETELILVTNGPKAIEVYYRGGHLTVVPPKTQAVDTTAGGDAFSGGILAGLCRLEQAPSALTAEQITKLVTFASYCGAHAVARQGAFTSLPTWENIKSHWTL